MASYTSDINALTSYSPYVQQQPIDAMVQVGVAKQQRYDEGIQKLQTQIDEVAGLPISKGAHKEYLQSKLNSLGKKLKTVAAGDFSNFQLVNSVAGMTNQIVKDPIIQNAVYSSHMIKKGQEELDLAKKGGKSSVQNEAHWNNQIMEWQNDQSVESVFGGNYVQFTDVRGKLKEVADKMKEIDSSVDIPYKRDAQGGLLYDENNTPIIDDALLRIKTKGKPAEKLLSNFMVNLDENDKRQLQIDSWYNYRNVTPDMLKNDIVSNYDSKKKMLGEELTHSNVELKTNTKLSSSQKAELEARINYLGKQLSDGSLENNLQQELQNLSPSNIEQYKYSVYTGKFLTDMANNMAYEGRQQEIINNPYAQKDMERKRLQFQYNNANRQQRNFEVRYNLDYQKWLKDQEDSFKSQYGAAFPGPVPQNVEVPTVLKLGGEIGALEDGVKQLNALYAPRIFDPSVNKDPDSRKKYLDDLMENYNQNPSFIKTVGPDMRDYLERRRNYEMDIAYKTKLDSGAREASSIYDGDLDKAMVGESGVVTPDGRMSPRELYEMYDKYLALKTEAAVESSKPTSNIMMMSKSSDMTSATKAVGEAVNTFLSSTVRDKDRHIAEILAKDYNNIPLSDAEEGVINKLRDLRSKYSGVNSQIIKNKLTAESEYLTQYAPSEQPTQSTINMEDKGNSVTVNNFIGYKMLQVEQHEIDEGFDPNNIKKFQKEKETKYVIERNNADGSGNLYVMSGKEIETIPISRSELETAFPEIARVDPLTALLKRATFSPDKTTNIFGGSTGANAINARLTGTSGFFPELANTKYAGDTRFDIEANPFNDGGANDTYLLRMYVFDDGVWHTDILNTNRYATKSGLQAIFNKIGPKDIEEFIERKK